MRARQCLPVLAYVAVCALPMLDACSDSKSSKATRSEAGAANGGDGGAAGVGGSTSAGTAGKKPTETAGAGGEEQLGGSGAGGVEAAGGAGVSSGGEPTSGGEGGAGNATPTITQVSIEGRPGKNVRQAEGVKLDITGTNLSGLSAVDAGGLTTTIYGSTDTSATISVVAGHGAGLGAHNLVLTVAAGKVTAQSAFIVTPISVATTGDDGNRGTPDSPFRHITMAVGASFGSQIGAADSIQVAAATYGTGETFNSVCGTGATIIGQSAATTIIDGAGSMKFGFFCNLSQIRVTNFGSSCVMRSNEIGAYTDVQFDACGDQAFHWDGGKLTLTRVKVLASKSLGIELTSVSSNLDASLSSVEVGSITAGGSGIGQGIYIFGSTNPLSVTIDKANVHDTAFTGLDISGVNVSVHVHNTTVSSHGVIVSDGTVLDFGTAATPGANSFSGGTPTFFDARADLASANGPIITLVGTQLDSMTFPTGIVVGNASNPPHYTVQGKNERISF